MRRLGAAAGGLLLALGCGSSGGSGAGGGGAGGPGGGAGSTDTGGVAIIDGGAAGAAGSGAGGGSAGTGAGGAGGPATGGREGDASAGSDAGADAGVDGPPDFGPNVLIFDATMPMATIQARLDAIFNQQVLNQFGAERYSFFFKPGHYALDIKLAYYMQVVGLGASPDDVVITGAVRVNDKPDTKRATGNFWRSCENVAIVPTAANKVNTWAVSQGASLRRVHVQGALALSDAGYSSGGFLANTKVDGQVSSGTQQQWFSRNAEWTSWLGGVWNMTFVGDKNAPAEGWPAKPYTVVASTPVVREKPFLVIDAEGTYSVVVPGLKVDSQGVDWAAGAAGGASIPLADFYVARADRDTAATMNAALAAGKHLLVTPGVYKLEASLKIARADTVVLGLGLATLVPQTGSPAVTIGDVDGVELAGMILDAGPTSSPTILQVGDPSSGLPHAKDPTALHDLVCRVGGAAGSDVAASCATIHSHDVVADNLWMWRADHDANGPCVWTQHPSKNGLVVNGDGVTAYGLFVEHFQEYQTVWNGGGGRVFFYQSEVPYDPPGQASWMHGAVNGFASYKVADSVATHEAWGVGVYCNFRDAVVALDSGIEAPPGAAGIALHHLKTVWLNGMPGSAINHVVNGMGNAVTMASRIATF